MWYRFLVCPSPFIISGDGETKTLPPARFKTRCRIQSHKLETVSSLRFSETDGAASPPLFHNDAETRLISSLPRPSLPSWPAFASSNSRTISSRTCVMIHTKLFFSPRLTPALITSLPLAFAPLRCVIVDEKHSYTKALIRPLVSFFAPVSSGRNPSPPPPSLF